MMSDLDKFVPVDNHILVDPEAPPTEKNGVLIPATVRNLPFQGEVVALGDQEEPFSVKVGDRIRFDPNRGTEIKVGSKDYLILREPDIYGII